MFLAVCGLIGFLGNNIVIYIYGVRLRRKYDARFFIPYLAIADLLAVIVIVGQNIYVNINPVNFDNGPLCSWGTFLIGCFSLWSMTILVLIVYQRKICRPREKTMSSFQKKISVLFSLVLSIALTVVFIFTVGIKDVENKTFNITGKICDRFSEELPTWSLIHSTVVLLFVIFSCGSLIVFYGLIGKVIYRYRKVIVNSAESQNTRTSSTVRFYKTTLMFMIMTVVFMISYLPTGIKLIIESVIKVEKETLIMKFLTTFFLVNHIANVFVYAFMDKSFSRELRRIFSFQS
ncbi:rhodopsin, GQ-coupled-like [Saccostrea echinata]|uniref:rhodopsin, GQ-coupled-like n=1 Tax=Saccostrea echinata TaxID=191078 RepID=UPI002A804632|nr:rhodopsin, GQ-coupled-like [Saccostrea echinata]